MKIAVGTDMKMPVPKVVVQYLQEKGHIVSTFGAWSEKSCPWPNVAIEVADKVAAGEFDQAILFCWTGTGISIAANKVKGIRAALCQDAQTAAGARKWNDANILCMSLRAISETIAREILDAWFSNESSEEEEDVACLLYLKEAEENIMK